MQTGVALDKTAEKAESVAVSAGRAPFYVSQSARLECSTGAGRGASKDGNYYRMTRSIRNATPRRDRQHRVNTFTGYLASRVPANIKG